MQEVDALGNSYLTGSSIVNGARAAWVTKLVGRLREGALHRRI